METITTDKAPAAVGPYSQAVRSGDLLFCSGQVGLDPRTGKIVQGGVEAQTRQALRNLKEVLGAAGVTLHNVVKATVFLADMNDFAAMNRVYAEEFGERRPARAAVQVARLPLDALVEIECIAALT